MLIDEITTSLNNMKQSGKVDLSIVNNLEVLSNLFKESKERWLMSSNTKINLYFYYAARVAELVVSRVKERFLSSNQVDANLRIIEDSLQVTGLLRDLHDLTQKKLPDEDSTKLVVERTRQLRVVATNVNILQMQEKELEDVDKLLRYISKLRK